MKEGKSTKRYFFSILTLFSLISLILVVSSTAYFTNETTHIMTDAFAEKHQRSISQLSYLFDNIHAQLIPGLKEASNNTFFYTNLMYSRNLTTYQIMLGMDALDDLLLSYPLIHSIYLYNGQMNFFLTTTSGLESADSFYDKEVLDILTNFDSGFVDYYWPRTGVFTLSPYQSDILIEKPTLTLLLGTTPTQKAHLKGAIIVNLDMGEVTNLLSAGSTEGEDEIFIYNQNGEFITRSGQLPQEILEQAYNRIRETGGEQGVLFEEDRLITYQFNYRLGWYFMGIMPLENINREIYKVIKAITAVMIIFMLLAFLFSYFSARFIYRPINRLLHFVSSGEREGSLPVAGKNEISLIQEQYMHLMTEKDSLVDSLQDLNDDYRVEIFHSLLEGHQYHFWLDELRPQDQDLLKGDLGLYLFQIDDFFDGCGKMDPEQFRKIRESLLEEMRKALDEKNELLIDMTGRNLVCLVPQKEGTLDRMEKLHEKLIRSQPLSLSLGCSFRDRNQPADLNRLYREAEERAGEKFLTGFGKIHRDIPPTGADPILPSRYIDSFFLSLRQGERDRCREKFNAILSYLKGGTFRDYRQFINIFAYRFLILLKDRKDSPLVPLLIQIRNNPQTLETLESFTRFFTDIYSEILSERSRTNGKCLTNYRLIENYMNLHFRDPSFCVQTLSEQTGLSPNYLRKIYREFSPISLSDRINELRLEEACRLLKETEDPIKELYERAGYFNYNSFFTSFKKGTGQTPALYRRKNQSA